MESNQRPTFAANLPEFETTDGADACALAAAYFGEPLEWQRWAMSYMLATDAEDRYLCKAFSIAIPRQNGKSWLIRARCLYGMIARGEKILFTCQHGDTSDEMFKSFAEIFEDEDNPALSAMLKAVRRTNGQQAIYLNNGGCIRFTTRTNSLARGKTYDVLIYDEAQELTTAQQAASLPTISASPTHNSQRIYLGTPPTAETPGDVFEIMHARVHGGESETPWIEWAASEVGDVFDRARWERCNPSFGVLLDAAAIAGEASDMPPESFATERLGWFRTRESAVPSALDAADWEACRAAVTPDDGVTVFAVKFSPDGLTGALCGAVRPDSGSVFVEGIRHFAVSDGLTWLADWLSCRAADCAEIVVDGQSNAQALHDRLRDAGVPDYMVVRPKTADVTAAFSSFATAVKERAVSHSSQPALDAAATRCPKRRIGTGGGWGFESTDDADACIVEAAALAFRQASITTKDQRRELRCG